MRSLIAALPLFLMLICGNAYADQWGKSADLYQSGMLGSSPQYGEPRWKSRARPTTALRNGAFGTLAATARAYMGETARDLGLPGRAWCADFMNKITGGGTHSRLARSYARYGSPAAYGCVDCIAVMPHHVGVVSGYDANGNPIIVSGNHGRRVGEGVYPKGRVIAWRYG